MGAARLIWESMYEADVRALLPLIPVPTTVVHVTGDRVASVEGARHLARPGSVEADRVAQRDAHVDVRLWRTSRRGFMMRRSTLGTEALAMTAQSVPDLLVESPEGVTLAVYARGSGPPLVLVHGSLQDHSISGALVDELASDFTCYSMDRRGFGASGDGTGYCIESEFDDIAAIVDHIAETTGRRVHLWGHSYGAGCAMGAATRTAKIDHLILYEPSLGIPYPPGVIDKIEEALASDEGDTAIALVLREILEFSDADIDAVRATPEWARRVEVAGTVPRECRAEQDWVYEPGRFDAVDVPTLLLAGSDSPDDLKQATARAGAAIPHATVHVMDGHAHVAHRTHPAHVASIIVDFALG